MDEMHLNWDDLRLFLAVARAGGLSAAARETGTSAPTLGRRVSALEAAMGAELFQRLPRGYALTEQGAALLAKVLDLEAQIRPLRRAASKVGPVVKISAGSWMTLALSQNIATVLKGNETTRLRFISAEHELDIVRREAFIGIRNRRPEQVGLACRKIGRVQFAGYAVSKAIEPWVKVLANTPSARWLAAQTGQALLEVSAPRNALDLACAGVARVLLPTFIGDAQRGLVRVTPPVAELAHDQWLVTHHELRFQPEIRRTIDRIFEVARTLHRRPPQNAISTSD